MAGGRENLKPFKPGQSGNPAGKPVGAVSIVAAIKRQLREKPELLEELAASVISNAKQGNAVALRQVLDRLDGPVPTVIDNLSNLTDDELREIAEGRARGTGTAGAEAESED